MGSGMFADADRFLALEAETIVDAHLDGDDLILVQHDGTENNVGSVRGIQGIPGGQSITPKAYDALPSTYPTGMTSFAYSVTTGWPSATGTVFTMIESIARGFQLISEKAPSPGGASRMWMRTVAQDNWGAFVEIGSKAAIDAEKATNDLQNLRLDTLTGTEMGVVDLNNYKTHGVYFQSTSAEAALGTNYPVAQAGVLTVHALVNTLVWQTYEPYSTYDDTFYKRSYVSGAWTSWKKFSAGETQVTIAGLTTGWAVYGSGFADPAFIRKGDLVLFTGGLLRRTVTTSLTISTTEHKLTSTSGMPAGWAPAANQQIAPLMFNTGGSTTTALYNGVMRVNSDGTIGILVYNGGPTLNAAGHWVTLPPAQWLAGQ